MRRLTAPQLAALAEIVGEPRTFAPSYTPIRKLAEAGLIVGKEGRWGSWTWHATDAGRSALTAQSGREGRDG